MMFLLQLIKDGKIQSLLKNGLRFLKQHNILREGEHPMTVTITFSDENGKKAQTAIRVTYKQNKLAKVPSILSLDTDDWTLCE